MAQSTEAIRSLLLDFARFVASGYELAELTNAAENFIATSPGLTFPADYIDIVFDGPPGPSGCRFVEVETPTGESVKVGTWINRGGGHWALRILKRDVLPGDVDLRIPASEAVPLADAPLPAELRGAITMDDCIYLPSQDRAAVLVMGAILIDRADYSEPLAQVVADKRLSFLETVMTHAKSADFAKRLAGALIALQATAACADCRTKVRINEGDPTPSDDVVILCGECYSREVERAMPPVTLYAVDGGKLPETMFGPTPPIMRDERRVVWLRSA